MMQFLLLISRQGKARLTQFFQPIPQQERQKFIKEVTQVVLSRGPKVCSIVNWRDQKIVYRRYASLYFITGIGPEENELLTLELIHHFVEILDRYFGNVCELDLIFNFHKAYHILDEIMLGGDIQESSKRTILRVVSAQDSLAEESQEALKKSGLGSSI